MSFGDYRLLTQIGAGRDGIAYRALAPDGSTLVEVHDLSTARASVDRWESLARRIRICLQLNHPCAIKALESHLDVATPYIVTECIEGKTLVQIFGDSLPLKPTQAIPLIQSLASALATAHQLGLTGCRFDPARIKLDAQAKLHVDFTGIETAASPTPDMFDMSETDRDRAGDIHRLGRLCAWLLTGSIFPAATSTGAQYQWLRAMLAVDPDERPTAREVEDGLRSWRGSSGDGFENGAKWLLPTGASSRPEELATCSVPLMPRAANVAVEPNLKLGRYRLLEVIGTGGQGVVYRAEDSADGSVVALKVLRPEWASRPEAAHRFRKEARLMAKLNNPHVVNLLDYNEDQGIPYIVMEFVTGQSLSDYLSDHALLDQQTALAIAIDVTRALEEAHLQGIVHRDVKPANILLYEEIVGSTPRLKLSDFGLARQIVESESLALTMPGSRLGTPHYMAPVQIMGRNVDSRTDVYSLGATLYHMIAGRPPFVAETREELHVMHIESAPPSLRQLNSALSDGLCRLVERALAKAPEDRYPDATAMRRDLERLARGEPTEAPLHPILPSCNPRKLFTFEFKWELESTPRELWPYVTNTDRLDRAHRLRTRPVFVPLRSDPACPLVRGGEEGGNGGILGRISVRMD